MKKLILILFTFQLCFQSCNQNSAFNAENRTSDIKAFNEIADKERIHRESPFDTSVTVLSQYNYKTERFIIKNHQGEIIKIFTRKVPLPCVYLKGHDDTNPLYTSFMNFMCGGLNHIIDTH